MVHKFNIKISYYPTIFYIIMNYTLHRIVHKQMKIMIIKFSRKVNYIDLAKYRYRLKLRDSVTRVKSINRECYVNN